MDVLMCLLAGMERRLRWGMNSAGFDKGIVLFKD